MSCPSPAVSVSACGCETLQILVTGSQPSRKEATTLARPAETHGAGVVWWRCLTTARCRGSSGGSCRGHRGQRSQTHHKCTSCCKTSYYRHSDCYWHFGGKFLEKLCFKDSLMKKCCSWEWTGDVSAYAVLVLVLWHKTVHLKFIELTLTLASRTAASENVLFFKLLARHPHFQIPFISQIKTNCSSYVTSLFTSPLNPTFTLISVFCRLPLLP